MNYFHNMLTALLAAIICMASTTLISAQQSPAAAELVQHVIEAAGGNTKLLKLFRMKEQYNSGTIREASGTPRTSVVEPPKSWWIDAAERGEEPAKIAAWAWTLGALTDPESKIEVIADVTDNETLVVGLQVTATVDPPLDMYFDKKTYQLVRVDWRDDIYRFSDWRDYDGTKYPTKCVLYRRKSGAPWFFHEILELERLQELPDGLKR